MNHTKTRLVALTQFTKHFLCFGICLGLCVGVTACGSLRQIFREATPTPQPTTVEQVSADQIAQAMQADSFYSEYGSVDLLIQGVVSSISQKENGVIVEFKTSVPLKVQCDLGDQAVNFHPGDTITVRVANPRENVARETGEIIMQDCAIQ
ncbi:MAG: hypothetical protein M1281_12350 [Chloroflexi bacterium]|nr:hypothetical protein [Chloroflexota bacterium]